MAAPMRRNPFIPPTRSRSSAAIRSTWKLKRSPRFTCRECGTRLFIEVERLGLRGVNGFLLPPGEFQPAFHAQCQFAVRPVVDDLPHYKAMPARFGGSDERVGW